MNSVCKYIYATFVVLLGLCFSLNAQQTETKVPISVYFPEDYDGQIPYNAQIQLANKLTSATAKAGVGATVDFTQFYLTYGISVLDSQIIAGAPAKYSQQLEITLYVVDAFAKKIFNAMNITQRGTGNSVDLAYIAAIKQFSPLDKRIQSFLVSTSIKILTYYNEQYKNIMLKAQALVSAQKYEEALWILATVPEACIGYSEVVGAAADIYRQYVDDQAHKKLAMAKALWSAGLDADSAYEAGLMLAEIPVNAKCYDEAAELQNEIKTRVSDNIQYERDLLAKREAVAAEIASQQIDAWKSVGVAYGNNQKAHTYHDAWILPIN